MHDGIITITHLPETYTGLTNKAVISFSYKKVIFPSSDPYSKKPVLHGYTPPVNSKHLNFRPDRFDS